MFKTITLILSITFILFGATADAGNVLPPNYEKGTITLTKGQTIDAYIQIDYFYPQRFQTELNYLDEKGYKDYKAGKKIKKLITKLKVKEVEGFTLENGKKYKQVKYSNTLATKTMDMMPKRFLLEVVTEGKITIYKKHYRTTGTVYRDVMNAYNFGGKDFIDFQDDNFELLYQKDKSKDPKNMIGVNLKSLLGDNQTVFDNYTNNAYGFQTEFTKSSKFAANVQGLYLDSLLKLLRDYNK